MLLAFYWANQVLRGNTLLSALATRPQIVDATRIHRLLFLETDQSEQRRLQFDKSIRHPEKQIPVGFPAY